MAGPPANTRDKPPFGATEMEDRNRRARRALPGVRRRTGAVMGWSKGCAAGSNRTRSQLEEIRFTLTGQKQHGTRAELVADGR